MPETTAAKGISQLAEHHSMMNDKVITERLPKTSYSKWIHEADEGDYHVN